MTSEANGSSQLLEPLLDVNESKNLPHRLRYDLRSPPPDATAVPFLEPDLPPISNIRAALEIAKRDLHAGMTTPTCVINMEAALEKEIAESRSLSRLSAFPHTTLTSLTPNILPEILSDPKPAGYLSPTHEAEYLSKLDAVPTDLPPQIREPGSHSPLPAPAARSIEKRENDRDLQLRNPVSVYNWLRKHQPSVFLQDNEGTSGKKQPTATEPAMKPSPKPSRSPKPSKEKGSKRSSAAPKVEQEFLDDDGFVIRGGGGDAPAPKSKRKREDDNSYRPKGGSSRPTKRKKISGGNSVKKTTEIIEDDQGT